MKKEHWKIGIIRNCIKQMEEDKLDGTVTRKEKHDAERTIRFYKLGEEFIREQVLKDIDNWWYQIKKQKIGDDKFYTLDNTDIKFLKDSIKSGVKNEK